MYFFNKNNKSIIEENKQLKSKKRNALRKADRLKEENEELTKKYTELLEEKGKGFDQYLYYHDLYADSYLKLKEQKKEIAELKSEVKRLNEKLEKKKPKGSGKNAKAKE